MKNNERPNQYPGTCASCGARVAAGEGTLGPKVAGKWTTRCAGHGVAARAARPADRRYNDDDGYDAMKDGACESGTYHNRPSRYGW